MPTQVSKAILIGYRIVLVISLLVYLPSLLLYRLDPAQYQWMGIISLSFLPVWFFLLALTIASIWVNKKAVIVLLALWAMGIPIASHFFAFRSSESTDIGSTGKDIRVMQWNCRGLVASILPLPAYPWMNRTLLHHMIDSLHPDIISLEEMIEMNDPFFCSNQRFFVDTLGYPYMSFKPYYHGAEESGHYQVGSAVFSKFPIVSDTAVFFAGREYPEAFQKVCLQIGDQKVWVFNTHFQSMQLFTPAEVSQRLSPELKEDSSRIARHHLLEKLRYYQPYHARQARLLRQHITSATIPYLVCADLNSLPSSWVYKHVKRNANDVFLASGDGWGATYQRGLLGVRIDYIFASRDLQPVSCKVVPTVFSDHHILLAEIRVPTM